MKDTLFKISYFYKVSIKTIQFDNQFCGDDIFYMKELLIEYKGQDVVIREEDMHKYNKTEEAPKPDEPTTIIKLGSLMKEYMDDLFKKNLIKDKSIYDPNANYHDQAHLYLNQQNGNLAKAFGAWKDTLELNMDEVLFRGALQSGCKKTGRKDGRIDKADGVNYLWAADGTKRTVRTQSDVEPNHIKNKNQHKKQCLIF